MIRLFLYFFIFLFFAIFVFALNKKSSLKLKLIYLFFFVFLIAFAIWFEYKNSKQDSKTILLIEKFNHGENIVCKEGNVSNQFFNYESGTQSFISKKDNLIIDIKRCEL
ncbi:MULTISPECIES: hypothetical protein [Campylobacter]|uniref:hypothetical protein n=1 Tax=Campylobacter TaxID=194 RepID=UPI00301CCB94